MSLMPRSEFFTEEKIYLFQDGGIVYGQVFLLGQISR